MNPTVLLTQLMKYNDKIYSTSQNNRRFTRLFLIILYISVTPVYGNKSRYLLVDVIYNFIGKQHYEFNNFETDYFLITLCIIFVDKHIFTVGLCDNAIEICDPFQDVWNNMYLFCGFWVFLNAY